MAKGIRSRVSKTTLILILLSISCAKLRAQSTASIQGTVVDQSGAAVPGAKITIRNQATGFEQTSRTDSAGNYLVPALPVGTYRIEIRVGGFQAQVVSDLKLDVATTVVQDFQLKIGTVTQEVTITGAVSMIETTTMAVSKVIDQATVQEMPLNGRHFVDLGLLLPGSVVAPQNGFLTAPLRGQGAFAFVTAGNREDTVNFMINGVNLNDMVQNQITFQPPISTIAEFKASNSTFSAEYGRNSGAIVNIATRSGTNDFHGEVFEFLRNEKLDAKNFFDKPDLPIPPFKRNQFGGDIGGPIRKDRTFFYFSFEGLRQRQAVPFNTKVLTASDRALVTNTTVKNLLPFIPLPNDTSGLQFQGTGTAPVNLDQFTGDVSHRLSEQDSIHGYYAFQRDLRGEPNLQGNNIPGFGDTRQGRRQIFTLNETHLFGPSVVNDFRMGFNRIHITFAPNALLNPSTVGINDGITTAIGIPQIFVAGALNIGGPAGFPQGRADTVYVWNDTVSSLRGKHSLKFGGEVRRFQNNNNTQDVGAMNFSTLTDFRNGNASKFSINAAGTFSSIRTTGIGLFIQDNYKLRSNLSVELGVRWDDNTTPSETHNRFMVFDPGTDKLVQVGSSGLSRVYNSNNKNFGPRFGFAWDPFKDGKTSVRAGYGLFYDQPVTNTVTGLSSNPPFGVPQSATGNVSISNPLASAGGAPSSSPNTINLNFRNNYVQEWNVNIQREVVKDFGVQVGYFGSKGTHLRLSRDQNQIVNFATGGRTFAGFSDIFIVDSPGNSSYNGLWISTTKRMSRGLQLSASYAWSHSIDYNSLNSQGGTGGVSVQDSNNVLNDRGSSDFDARHHFNISYLYQLPFKGNRLKDGWEIAGNTTFQSGNPVNLVIPGSKTGLVNIRRPNLTGDPGLSNPDPALWFNTAAFCDPDKPTPPCGTSIFGNLGRNVIIGPGFNNFDFSVIKNNRISEKLKVQFRTEFFDIFNHENLGQPGRIVGSPSFGQILNTRGQPGDGGSARQIQFALKLIF